MGEQTLGNALHTRLALGPCRAFVALLLRHVVFTQGIVVAVDPLVGAFQTFFHRDNRVVLGRLLIECADGVTGAALARRLLVGDVELAAADLLHHFHDFAVGHIAVALHVIGAARNGRIGNGSVNRVHGVAEEDGLVFHVQVAFKRFAHLGIEEAVGDEGRRFIDVRLRTVDRGKTQNDRFQTGVVVVNLALTFAVEQGETLDAGRCGLGLFGDGCVIVHTVDIRRGQIHHVLDAGIAGAGQNVGHRGVVHGGVCVAVPYEGRILRPHEDHGVGADTVDNILDQRIVKGKIIIDVSRQTSAL